MSSSYHDYTHQLTASTTPTIIHVLSLLILVIVLLIHSIQLIQKLNQTYRPSILALNPQNQQNNNSFRPQSNSNSHISSIDSTIQIKISLIYRIHIFLQICFWCYIIRITLLSIKVYDRVNSGVNTGIIYHLPLIIWVILTNWIPTIIPVCTYISFF